MSKRAYRTGIISKEEAEKRFHEYYNNRSETPIARLRAKMFDMMYQKKPKFILTPGQPGSEKYMLEEGPRTFDMEGIDYFDEGEKFIVENKGQYEGHIAVSKGATYKKATDNVTKINIDSAGKETSPEIYGPRIRGTQNLYNTYFKKTYEDRRNLPLNNPSTLKDTNLVNKYWALYKKDSKKHGRKNKSRYLAKSYTFMSYDAENICTIHADDLNNVIVNDFKEPLDDFDKNYLLKLNILIDGDDGILLLNEELLSSSVFKITIDLNLYDDDDKPGEYILDIMTSKLYYLDTCKYTDFTLNQYLEDLIVDGSMDNIIDSVPSNMCVSNIKTTAYETISQSDISSTPPSNISFGDLQTPVISRKENELTSIISTNIDDLEDAPTESTPYRSPVITSTNIDDLEDAPTESTPDRTPYIISSNVDDSPSIISPKVDILEDEPTKSTPDRTPSITSSNVDIIEDEPTKSTPDRTQSITSIESPSKVLVPLTTKDEDPDDSTEVEIITLSEDVDIDGVTILKNTQVYYNETSRNIYSMDESETLLGSLPTEYTDFYNSDIVDDTDLSTIDNLLASLEDTTDGPNGNTPKELTSKLKELLLAENMNPDMAEGINWNSE